MTQVTRQPYVMIVHPSVPAASARELIAWAKANPSRLNYASAGSGSLMHLTGELFKSATVPLSCPRSPRRKQIGGAESFGRPASKWSRPRVVNGACTPSPLSIFE